MKIPSHFRIAFLLFILVLVAADAWLSKQRVVDWDAPLWLTIFPINGDGGHSTAAFIAGLNRDVFVPIERFFAHEMSQYRDDLQEPLHVMLAAEVDDLPPHPPENPSLLAVMWWSLKFRFWAYKFQPMGDAATDLKMFVVFWDPTHHQELRHSFGLEKGLAGVMNGFAVIRMKSTNNVVIAHEVLHLLGASDKYDLATLMPVYPDGFADPEQQPLYPQVKAEIMAGRIPVSETQLVMPNRLGKTMIGIETAAEIGWID